MTTLFFSSAQFEYLQKAFDNKKEDPFTRQEFFGELSAQEEKELYPLTVMEQSRLFELREPSSRRTVKVFIYPENFSGSLSVSRTVNELEKEVPIRGHIQTSHLSRCPLTGKLKMVSWNSYVSEKFWNELKSLFD